MTWWCRNIHALLKKKTHIMNIMEKEKNIFWESESLSAVSVTGPEVYLWFGWVRRHQYNTLERESERKMRWCFFRFGDAVWCRAEKPKPSLHIQTNICPQAFFLSHYTKITTHQTPVHLYVLNFYFPPVSDILC